MRRRFRFAENRRQMRLPVLPFCLFLCGLAVSTAKAGEFRDPLPSGAVRQVRDTAEIISEYLHQQEMFLPIAPPDPDFILIQGGGLLLFDPINFSAPFVDGLLPAEIDGIAVFPVTVFEDPLTHE